MGSMFQRMIDEISAPEISGLVRAGRILKWAVGLISTAIAIPVYGGLALLVIATTIDIILREVSG